eukprot:SAG31_NODE_288_length_18400_cov_55.018851_11_plen_173_part_00
MLHCCVHHNHRHACHSVLLRHLCACGLNSTAKSDLLVCSTPWGRVLHDAAVQLAMPLLDQPAYQKTGAGGAGAVYTLAAGLTAGIFAVIVFPELLQIYLSLRCRDADAFLRHFRVAWGTTVFAVPALWLATEASKFEPELPPRPIGRSMFYFFVSLSGFIVMLRSIHKTGSA